MSARRLILVAAALGIAASEYALWVQLRDTLHALAEVQRRVEAHRCPVLPAAAPVPGEGDFLTSRMPEYQRLTLPPMTDPALKEHRG